ncbi:amino acid transporter AVT6B-like isoform X2 [Hibiscus syriacus]|uniref:amino acid transporter AVT6B-like isoform X2 n=1 Tax=Hibiscus syriacus TaxID=106335 RepID=UPI0019240FB4|nr:amino acid transporter AVT6B-like isoform X2 [Hibiscus syriacus]
MTMLPTLSDRKHRRSPRAALLSQKIGYQEFESPEGSFHGASISGAVFNLSTTVVGAGIMALPATVNQLGLIPGLVAIIFVSMLTESSIDKILRFSRASKSTTYSGVAADTFGRAGRNILQACIVINNTGMLVVYMVIIDSLRYTSALSVGFAVMFVAITAGVTIVKLMEGKIGMPRLMPILDNQASFWKLFTTVPVLVTAYICHHNILPIENELKDPTQMKLIVRKSLIFCTAIYIATSFFGVLLFGDHILDDVLANFDADLGIPYSSLLDDLIRLSYCLHLMLVFPIVFFSLRLNIDGLLFPYAIPIAISKRRFISTTVALMGFIFVGANFIPSIWDAFQFTGATAAVCVSYIFPAAITLRDTHGIATKNDRLISWMMIFLAVSTSTVAVTSDIYGLFSVDKGVVT